MELAMFFLLLAVVLMSLWRLPLSHLHAQRETTQITKQRQRPTSSVSLYFSDCVDSGNTRLSHAKSSKHTKAGFMDTFIKQLVLLPVNVLHTFTCLVLESPHNPHCQVTVSATNRSSPCIALPIAILSFLTSLSIDECRLLIRTQFDFPGSVNTTKSIPRPAGNHHVRARPQIAE